MTTGTIRPATGTVALTRLPVLTGNPDYVFADLPVPGWGTLVLMSREVPPRPAPAPASPVADPGSQGR